MSDLLKQAIADAKAVRATALSNAKAALEEHFAPKLQSMLSEKLKAEVAMEEEETLPVADEVPVAPEAAPVEAPVAPEVAPEAAPVEAPVGEEPALEEIGMEEEMDEARGTEQAGHYDVTQHGVSQVTEGEKASSDYKKETKGHKTDNKGQEIEKAVNMKTPAEGKSPEGSRKATDNYDGKDAMKKGSPVKDMHNKAPKTDNKGQEMEKAVNMSTPALKEGEEEVDEASLDEILKELEASVHEVGMEEAGMHQEAAAHHEDEGKHEEDEELDLNELLSEDSDKEDEKEEKEEKDEDDKKPDFLKENISLKKELEEYRSAVVYLRDRINEVNLLNAKLLYTNKLFKQASLTNEQKLKVIESFDLTKSVREAKLVYATLAESFNFGGKKVVEEAKKPVSTTVKTITEGLASKPVASTKPTNAAVLTEGAEMANRFKKLAGIRK